MIDVNSFISWDVVRTVGAVLLAVVVGQGMKLGTLFKQEGLVGWNRVFKEMLSFGGMPSTHSLTVTALTVSLYLSQGLTLLTFSVFVFSVFVIKDAVGLRGAVQKHAEVLNKKVEEVELTERIGHTPLQAFIGVVLGVIIPLLVWLLF